MRLVLLAVIYIIWSLLCFLWYMIKEFSIPVILLYLIIINYHQLVWFWAILFIIWVITQSVISVRRKINE